MAGRSAVGAPTAAQRAHLSALAAAAGAAALLLGARRRGGRLSSHPLAAYLLENGGVVATAALTTALVPLPRARAGFLTWLASLWATSAMAAQVFLGIQAVLVYWVYDYIPRFSEKGRPEPTLRSMLKDWLTCNAPVDLFNAAVGAAAVGRVVAARRAKGAAPPPARAAPGAAASGLHVPTFLLKLAIMRVVVDWGFYWGHRAIHHPRLWWIHRKHHEHNKPGLVTNYHFSPLDLWIEAVMPMVLGIGLLHRLGFKSTQFENQLFVSYIGWHEAASHCSKPLPTMTYFPPLAPLYHLVVGNVDRHNVRHHDLHHTLFACNYGITPWPDVIMGTCRPRRLLDDIAEAGDTADMTTKAKGVDETIVDGR